MFTLKHAFHGQYYSIWKIEVLILCSTRTVDLHNDFSMRGFESIIMVLMKKNHNNESVDQELAGKAFEQWTWRISRKFF